jgi:hypothetical protein
MVAIPIVIPACPSRVSKSGFTGFHGVVFPTLVFMLAEQHDRAPFARRTVMPAINAVRERFSSATSQGWRSPPFAFSISRTREQKA